MNDVDSSPVLSTEANSFLNSTPAFYYSGNQTHMEASRLVLITVYTILVVVGLLGNAIVISMILKVVIRKALVTNVYIYVLCLSALDFAYLATGPFLIIYMINGNWHFGDGMCKLSYVFEGLNKTMSIYLLVILSGDRYMAACHPTTLAKYRTIKSSLVGLLIVGALVALSNIPIYMYANVIPVPGAPGYFQCGIWFPTLADANESVGRTSHTSSADQKEPSSSTISYSKPQRQQTSVWNNFASYYLLFLIIVYYIIPAFFILLFYFKIVLRLRQQYHVIGKTPMKRNRVTKSVLTVVVFYLICWTPYWLLQTIITFMPNLQYASPRVLQIFIYVATAVYTLPYVNSCLDPILYAFMNKHLWIAYAASTRKRFEYSSRIYSLFSRTHRNFTNNV